MAESGGHRICTQLCLALSCTSNKSYNGYLKAARLSLCPLHNNSHKHNILDYKNLIKRQDSHGRLWHSCHLWNFPQGGDWVIYGVTVAEWSKGWAIMQTQWWGREVTVWQSINLHLIILLYCATSANILCMKQCRGQKDGKKSASLQAWYSLKVEQMWVKNRRMNSACRHRETEGLTKQACSGSWW